MSLFVAGKCCGRLVCHLADNLADLVDIDRDVADDFVSYLS